MQCCPIDATKAGMERTETIARLKAHEAELRQFGVQHLYLFGSTARDDAREGSDVDLFFRPRARQAQPVSTDGCQGARRRNPWLQDGHHDPAQFATALAATDRNVSAASFLMAVRAATLRLHEIIRPSALSAAKRGA
jgi:hypothetical protein